MIKKTSLLDSIKYSKYTQNSVYLKPENLQTSGSFKIRGLFPRISSLKEQGYKRIIVASTGNQAKSAAYACDKLGIACVVVMPVNTSYNKIQQLKDLNVEVIREGNDILESVAYARTLNNDESFVIELFHDEESVLAYGSMIAEIVEELPETDIILVPVGTGGLLYGVLKYIENNDLKIKVYGVEPYKADSLFRSIDCGHVIDVEYSDTIADTLNLKQVSETFFLYIKDNVAGVIRVSDEELIDCFLDVIEEHKIVVDNAGLVSLAGCKYLRERQKNVVCILSGGNVDVTTMSSLLQYSLINKGRIFTFATMLSDKPGELVEIATIIAENNGNVIGLKHNQLSVISRNNKVVLEVSVETFGLDHKFKICSALENKGYNISLIDDNKGSGEYE